MVRPLLCPQGASTSLSKDSRALGTASGFREQGVSCSSWTRNRWGGTEGTEELGGEALQNIMGDLGFTWRTKRKVHEKGGGTKGTITQF